MSSDIATLTRRINNEVIVAMGLRPDDWIGNLLQAVLTPATRRFSALFAGADRVVAEQGLIEGARTLLSRLVSGVADRGGKDIPGDGPLIIASNHPGTVDSICLAATAGRDDLRIVASDVPFLAGFDHIREHLILLPRKNLQCRMLAARQAIRHLRAGGAILLFAGGTIDPDPAFMKGGEVGLRSWSRSLELFVRDVPGCHVVTSIVSHVIDPAFMRHPLTLLRRSRPDKQRLAMMIQIIQQMLGRRLEIIPRITFGTAISRSMLPDHRELLAAIIEGARRLMESHRAWQP
jgi:hypothetical protein